MKKAYFSFQDEGKGATTYTLREFVGQSKNIYEIKTDDKLKVDSNIRFTECIPSNDGDVTLIEEDGVVLSLYIHGGQILITVSNRPNNIFVLV